MHLDVEPLWKCACHIKPVPTTWSEISILVVKGWNLECTCPDNLINLLKQKLSGLENTEIPKADSVTKVNMGWGYLIQHKMQWKLQIGSDELSFHCIIWMALTCSSHSVHWQKLKLAKKVTIFWHRGCIFTWFITILLNSHIPTEEQDLNWNHKKAQYYTVK